MELTREQLRQLLLRETATLNEEDDSNFDAERVNIMLDYCIKELKKSDPNTKKVIGALKKMSLMVGEAFLK